MTKLYDEEDLEYRQYMYEDLNDSTENLNLENLEEDVDNISEEDQIKITSEFLDSELKIKYEVNRTLLKFSYKNINYEGKVISKFKDNKYIFLITSPDIYKNKLKSIDIDKID